MKKCGYCGHQNEDSLNVCSGCGESLEKPPGAKAEPDLKDPALDPVIVGIFENIEHAGVLATRLEAAGIEAWIPERFSFEFPPQTVSVQVAARDAQAARAIAAGFSKPVASSPVESGSPRTKTCLADTVPSPIPGRRACVSCGAAISHDAVLCPKCGWTQPQFV